MTHIYKILQKIMTNILLANNSVTHDKFNQHSHTIHVLKFIFDVTEAYISISVQSIAQQGDHVSEDPRQTK